MLARVAAALRAFHDGPPIPGHASTRSASSRPTARPRSSAGGACPTRTSGRTRSRGGSRRGAAADATRPVPQRPPERELPRRRRAPAHRRLGVRGHGRPLLRPRELLDQPRARRRRRARRCSRRTSARCATRTLGRSSSCASCPTSARRCGASCSRPSRSSTSTSTRTRREHFERLRRTARVAGVPRGARPERREGALRRPLVVDVRRLSRYASVGSSNCAELLLLEPLELLVRAHAHRALEPVLAPRAPTSRRRGGRCPRTRSGA